MGRRLTKTGLQPCLLTSWFRKNGIQTLAQSRDVSVKSEFRLVFLKVCSQSKMRINSIIPRRTISPRQVVVPIDKRMSFQNFQGLLEGRFTLNHLGTQQREGQHQQHFRLTKGSMKIFIHWGPFFWPRIWPYII